MFELNRENIRKYVADSKIIFQRGVRLYEYGAFCCTSADLNRRRFSYEVDGKFGDYATNLDLSKESFSYSCDCPYPGAGCKHTVAVMLDAADRLGQWQIKEAESARTLPADDFLTAAEIRQQALEDRRKRAKSEYFIPTLGDMFKGEHILGTRNGREYSVTLHDPDKGAGHCSCPDFLTNRLGTCKHLIHLSELLKKTKNFARQLAGERFPFIDIYWDSVSGLPRCFWEQPAAEERPLQEIIGNYFDSGGLFTGQDLGVFPDFMARLGEHKRVCIRESVLTRVDDFLARRQLEALAGNGRPSLEALRASLYPYQKEGVDFVLFRKAALIGDEMGLGKTLQAIAAAILKKEVFGFSKVLVVTLASLKDQWQREISRFTDERAVVVAGGFKTRKHIYLEDESLFKITNYEAVLRDAGTIAAFKPDLVILDEAQRIKNFETKTAGAIKALPRNHALVLTGTPLENKLEDVYSIVQFLEPGMLSPLWQFAADHFMLSRKQQGRIAGYHNLDRLYEKLKGIALRRRKQEVLSELPAEVTNNYYVDLDERQVRIHAGYWQSLQPLLNKKFLTPMDLRRIQELLLKMRQVCDSTYLIDRETHISPKMKELSGILDELVQLNGRKVVIFSEWTTMTFLIGRHLSEAGIPFVELSGKVPVNKRQTLVDEFTNNPACKVFLSTDAGGTGLNLQAGDCVVNFELPWNPARLNQRIGRVSRIGQQSTCVNVVNIIAKRSIEERILAGIQLKTDLFKGVFDGEGDKVEFSREKRAELLNTLRVMMGEESEPVVRDGRAAGEDIPEDAPHFLNPTVLEDEKVDYTDEEQEIEALVTPAENSGSEKGDEMAESAGKQDNHSSGRMETVLNQGMAFISGLLEMATGRKIEAVGDDDRLIRLDKETGEVVMKFKLPGF